MVALHEVLQGDNTFTLKQAKNALSDALREALIEQNIREARAMSEVNKLMVARTVTERQSVLSVVASEEAAKKAAPAMPSTQGTRTWPERADSTLQFMRSQSGKEWPEVRRVIEAFLQDDATRGPL